MKIGDRLVGPEAPPFIIGEMSGNHGGSLEGALEIVDAIAEAGADAVKLQTYTPDTMTLDLALSSFHIDDPTSLWRGRSLYDLYAEARTPYEWHAPIFQRAREHGIAAFSSPFDPSAVDFLEGLHVPAYKIASLEITDLPLIRRAAQAARPLIISTGTASLGEIDDAVATARGAGCEEIMLLQCTTSYPASPTESNLRSIPMLVENFECLVGLSDHTLGIGAAVAAVAMGACAIEKHVTLSRDCGAVDAAFSIEPDELAQLVIESRVAWEALGSTVFGPTATELESRKYRRSLWVTEDLPAGTVLTTENVRALRPAGGLPPGRIEDVVGLAVSREVSRGTPLTWDLVKEAAPPNH